MTQEHPEQTATVAELMAARQELLAALEGLGVAELESPLGPGQWRIRDVLAHITHWNRWGLNRLRYLVRHGSLPPNLTPIDADAVNQRIAETWALHPLGDVLCDLEGCHEELIAFIRSLPPEWAGRTWESGGRPQTLRRWFGYAASHERSHAAELRSWRVARPA